VYLYQKNVITTMIKASYNEGYSKFEQFVQIELIKEKFPHCRIQRSGETIIVDFKISDPDLSSVYRVCIFFKSQREHKVFVISPGITPSIAIHMYRDQSLCLYYPPDISPFRRLWIALDLIPLTVSWVFLYERWLINGHIWEGAESPEHWWLMKKYEANQ